MIAEFPCHRCKTRRPTSRLYRKDGYLWTCVDARDCARAENGPRNVITCADGSRVKIPRKEG